jgi:hypothetical protein
MPFHECFEGTAPHDDTLDDIATSPVKIKDTYMDDYEKNKCRKKLDVGGIRTRMRMIAISLKQRMIFILL